MLIYMKQLKLPFLSAYHKFVSFSTALHLMVCIITVPTCREILQQYAGGWICDFN